MTTEAPNETPDPFPPTPDPVEARPGVTRRSLTFGVSLLGATVLLAAMAVIPAPYAIRSPGPTEDVLGEDGDVPLIEISGARTFESSGQLRLTTVTLGGGPDYPVNVSQVLSGWFDPARSVRPVEETFPRGQTSQQVSQRSQQEMLSSQENATVAALTELGYEVPAVLTIAGTQEGLGADGVAREGDVITALNGEPVTTYDDLVDDLAAIAPGSDVTLGVDRDGEPLDLVITTTAAEGKDSAVLGVLIDPAFDYPVDVTIQIDDIGGPSAGTMFALGIIDKLTPEDEANGEVIAGTGTIDSVGVVGPIGGIEQKMHGALRDGASWFLAPEDNCPDVVGAVPDGLRVTRIATLAEARAAVEAIGRGEGDTLPTCS